MNGFIGGGAHWRVLRRPVPFKVHREWWWQVYRRHWDRWEEIGEPHLSHAGAMTEAHRLARLNRA